jgi:endoglucanase
MCNTSPDQHTPRTFVAGAALLLISIAGAHGQSNALPLYTRFFVPQPPNGAVQQVESLFDQGQLKNALLIAAMETVSQAVWLTGGTASEVSATVTSTLKQANWQGAVPVLVLYDIPGRDCGSYSAGGAENTAEYEAWVDAIAAAIGSQKVVIVLEPDSLADLPSDCGYNPSQANIPQLTADRYTQITYAVTTLETGS